MTDYETEATRTRAYEIWEREGRPTGQHESHWRQALAELGLIHPFDDDRSAIAARAQTWDEAKDEE